MSTQIREQAVKLSDVFRRVFFRWRVIVVFMVAFGVAGAGLSMVASEKYTATATLTVSPITTNPFSSAAVNQQININTEREILQSREVAAIAAQELGPEVTPDQLLDGAEVAAPSGSQVLRVSITAATPQMASDFANAMASAYLQFRAAGAAEIAAGYITELDQRIAALEAIDNQDAVERTELISLREQRADLTLVAANPGRVIGEANPPSGPSSPGTFEYVLIGLVLGLLAGAAAAALRDRTDSQLRSSGRMSDRLVMPVIAFVANDHQEGFRWTLRAIGEAHEDSAGSQSGTARVGLFGVSGENMASFTSNLAAAAQTAQLSVTQIGPPVLSEDAVDKGWPTASDEAGWEGQDLVLLDGSGLGTGTRRAALSDHLTHVIIVGFGDSKVEDLDRLLAELSGAHGLGLTAVFLSTTTRRRGSPERYQRQHGAVPPPNADPSPTDADVASTPEPEPRSRAL